MYLKVTIPSRYAFPKSVGDPTIMDVTPLLSPNEDHLFINLNSYQTPWSQLNKKDEVFKIDNRRTLYPAFRTTSKIRPKMLPTYLSLFNFGNLGGKIKYAPLKEKLDYTPPHSYDTPVTYSKLEGINNEAAAMTYTLATQNLTKEIYNVAYQKFFNIRGQSVMDFMEWVGTQRDLVGVWNHNHIDAEQLKKVAKVAYIYEPSPDSFVERVSGSALNLEESIDNSLNVDYDQKILAVTPYVTHPDFQQSRQPVPLLYSYDSELDVERAKMKHNEGWSPTFNPPVLDWEAVGFPRVATTATKALYARQPIHLQFNTQEKGFLKQEELENDKFLATIIEECDDYEKWFTKLTEPIVLSGERVYNKYILRGSVRSITEMSRNEANYFDDNDELCGATLNFQSTGKAYQFALQIAELGEKASHFPSGSLPSEMTKCAGVTDKKWEDLYLPPPGELNINKHRGTPQNYYSMPLMDITSRFEHPLNEYWKGGGKKSRSFLDINKGLSASLAAQDTKENLTVKFKDVVLFPRFSYHAETMPFTSFPTLTSQNSFDNRWLKRRANQHRRTASATSRRFDYQPEPYDLLNEIMEHYLIPNEFEFNQQGQPKHDEGNEMGLQIPLLIKVIDAINKYGPDSSIKIEMVKGVKAVRLIQDLSFKFDDVDSYLAANPTSPLHPDQLGGRTRIPFYLKKIAEHKGLPLEYQIILYPHPDNQGLSILTTIPAIPTFAEATNNRLKGLFDQWECRDLLGKMAFKDELFKNATTPLFLDNISRYSPTEKSSMFALSGEWKPSMVESILKGTAFEGYSYSLSHIRSMTTLSDPKNTLPLTIKRNKITVKRPFSYTSIFPVLGKKGEVPISLSTITPISHHWVGVTEADIRQTGIKSLHYSPVAHYVVPESSKPSLPNNIPQYQFKNMNTNSRTFKAQRNSEGYAGRYRAKDYTTFSEIILPFENLTESLITATQPMEKKGRYSDNIMAGQLLSIMVTEDLQGNSVNLQLPFLKNQNNKDARSENASRARYLSNNMAEWSLGVPTDFVPETYTLSGMELGLFNWPFGLV